MGFWDAVAAFFNFLTAIFSRKKKGSRAPQARTPRAPPDTPRAAARDPSTSRPRPGDGGAMDAALANRRMGLPPLRRGKPLSAYRLRQYERLERMVTVTVGRFPWSSEEARRALLAKGFNAREVEAYLASDAARRLLGP